MLLSILYQELLFSRVPNNHTTSIKFIGLAKKDNLMLLKQFKAFSINLNAQDVNEMTHIESWKYMYVY